MPGTTAIYGLRYQEPNDAPNGAALGANLAADVESQLARIDGDITDTNSALTTLSGSLTTGAWSAWTPALTGASSGGTIGNGTMVARSTKLGRLVVCEFDLTFGSTTSFGTGAALLTIPATARATTPGVIGTGFLADGSNRTVFVINLQSTTQINFMTYNGVFVSAGSPYTMGSGDLLKGVFQYESAS